MNKQTNYFIITALISYGALYGSEKSNKTIAHYEKKQFAYLGSKTFQKRHQLAAEWTQDCPLIIEIGGGRNSMSTHLINEQKIIVIDPTIRNKNEDSIVHTAKKFEDWQLTDD